MKTKHHVNIEQPKHPVYKFIIFTSLLSILILNVRFLFATDPNGLVIPKDNKNDSKAISYQLEGESFAKRKDYRNAIKNFNKAILLNSQHAEHYYSRALAKTYIDQIESSIPDCDTAILLNPDYAEAFLVRGVSKALLGESESSMQDFNTAIKLKDNYGEAYYNIGLNYYELKDEINAKLNFKKANELGYKIPDLAAYLAKN